MNISPINGAEPTEQSFKGLFTKPKSVHENERNIMRNVEESYYYRFSNEPKAAAEKAVEKATEMIDVIIDSESGLRFEQGRKATLRGKLPFSTGEWLQYASFNKNLPDETKTLIEAILKRYGLKHYIRQAKV